MEVDLKQGLLAAFRRLMRPLVRILIRNGVAYGEFAEITKEVYVDVAASDFKVAHRKMSQSRIAILTGLTRKDVARIIGGKKNGGQELKNKLNRVARVLTGWHTDTEYTGPYGLPVELRFENTEQQVDFLRLVNRYSGDMAARAMLDELQRIGVVTETEPGWYRAVTRTYTPAIDSPDSLERLGGVVYNFINTVDRNVVEQNPIKRNFERLVFPDNGIRKEDLPRFSAYIKIRAQLFLEEIDNWLSQLDSPNPDDKNPVRTGLGIYHYIDDELVTKNSTKKNK